MNELTNADIMEFFDGVLEKKANAEFLSACKDGNLAKIEYELQHGRDPNLAVLEKSPLMYAKGNPEIIKLLLEYGADPVIYGFYHYCQKFFKDELLEICKPHMTVGGGRDVSKRLQNGLEELKKRYALCRQANCKTIVEYNLKAGKHFKRYFMVFPFVHTLTVEERKMLFNIACKGRAADIHVAIGAVDEKLPAELAMCCQEKIAAPIGANTLQQWYCPAYSATVFQTPL